MTEPRQRRADERLSTGCDGLDALLGGGFERGVVSQLYGAPATGKTNICLQTAVETIEDGGSVAYLDTEGVSLDRFRQIAGDDADRVGREFIVKEAFTFDEQAEAVRDVENLANEVDLVVLDSATGLYRVEAEREGEDAPLKKLSRQITHLTALARKHDLAVVATNQIYTDIDGGEYGQDEVAPLGGTAMEHWTKTIVRLERRGDDRVAVLEKHRSREVGQEAGFAVTDEGVESG